MIRSFSFELTLIRHGKTDANGNTYQGELPFDLNQEGIKQMEAAAEEVKGLKEKIGALFCSKMLRAQHSAELVNQTLDKPIKEIPAMREFKIGVLQGKTKDVYQQMLAEAKKEGLYETLEQKHAFVIRSGEVDGQYIEGESVDLVYRRAIASLTEIAEFAKERQDEGEAAIVHEWWTRCLIAKAYGLDKDQIRIENGGIISLTVAFDPTAEKQPLSYTFNVDKCRKCFIDTIELPIWIKNRLMMEEN